MKKDITYFFSYWTETTKETGGYAAMQMWDAVESTWDPSLEARYFYTLSPSKVGLGETSRISNLRAYRENFS